VLAVDFGLVMLTSTLSTLAAGALAASIGPLATLYVMLGLMVASASVWWSWSRPARRPAMPSVTGD
jgi:hypothetical protein